jgi:hypothetical protein
VLLERGLEAIVTVQIPQPEAPKSVEEYKEWAAATLALDFGQKASNLYDVNARAAHLTVQEHPFFTGLDAAIHTLDATHIAEYSAPLMMSGSPLQLHIKSYDSLLNKIFRKNVVWTRKFPGAPSKGWVTPDNIFEQLDDIVRGKLVCKFIDGPAYLSAYLEKRASDYGLKCNYQPRDLDDGYYAYHFYVAIPVELLLPDLSKTPGEVTVELQLSTQLQESLYEITHRFYVDRRVDPNPDKKLWKWDVGSNRFRAGYLAHTLHLLEGIIVELRDKSLKEEKLEGSK